MKTSTFLVPAALATFLVPATAGVHPNLTITAGEVAAIRAELGRNSLFDTEFAAARKRVDDALEYVDLQDKQDSLVRHLSRGMVQRMGVGIRLVHDPDLYLLDEPASGLDPKARIQLRNVLRRLSDEGKTILISSHILTELSGFCSHIAIMDKGAIRLSGAVEEVQRTIIGAKRVDISVLSDCPRAVELAGRFPGAKVTAVHQDTFTVEVPDNPKEMASLNAYLVREGVEVIGFSERKADLEELFMRISDGEGAQKL